MAKEREELSRREIRRQRRKRAQILSYLLVVFILVIIVVGAIFAGKFAIGFILDKRQEAKLEKEQEILESEAAVQEEQAETEIIETEAEEEVEEYTEEDLLEEMVDAGVMAMSLEDRIAGILMTTPEALTNTKLATKAGDGTEAALLECAVGGLVYSEKNVQSDEQFSTMLTDTIARSKYSLFFVMDGESAKLTEDLSTYGINMEFADKSEETEEYRIVTLPSLLNGETDDGLKVAEILPKKPEATEEAERPYAKQCKAALQKGADVLYITEKFKETYAELLEEAQSDKELQELVEKAIENIYRTKYKNRLSE